MADLDASEAALANARPGEPGWAHVADVMAEESFNNGAYVTLFPNTMLSVFAGFAATFRLTPTSVNTTLVERDYLWTTYANDPRARINVGIRRRLAPLMDNDRRKIELMNSLLLSFPGTPIIYYGDEIGMGDNIYLGDRNGVRTPMQWTPDRNGGFSRADPARLYAPTIMDPVYGYESVNVEAQSRSLSSLLSATKRLIAVRKSTFAFGRGTMTFIRPENRSVLCYVRQYQGEVILCVANLSRSAQATELDLSAFKDRIPLEMLGRTRFPPIGELPYMITLAPYGFYWFELQERDKSEPVRPRAVPEFETLVVPVGSMAKLRGVLTPIA